MFLNFLVFLHVFIYHAWPGLVITENWKCLNDIFSKSKEDKIL